MLKLEVARGAGGRVVAMDSITQVQPQDEGAYVVAASHGGTSSGEVALTVPLRGVFFNDAGVGKNGAGIAALALLQARGVAAGAVSHLSARIGDARDMWDHGVILHVNPAAARIGLAPGVRLREALTQLLQG
jgi:hypothetical protein